MPIEFPVGASDLLRCGVISTEAFDEDVYVVITPSFVRSVAPAIKVFFMLLLPAAALLRFDFLPLPEVLFWARLTTTTLVVVYFFECVVLLLPVSELRADWVSELRAD